MLNWNVGGVYLVAFAFQAVILVFAIYTLVFLKSVFVISQTRSYHHYSFQEKTMEESGAQCHNNIIHSIWALLIFAKIQNTFHIITGFLGPESLIFVKNAILSLWEQLI